VSPDLHYILFILLQFYQNCAVKKIKIYIKEKDNLSMGILHYIFFHIII